MQPLATPQPSAAMQPLAHPSAHLSFPHPQHPLTTSSVLLPDHPSTSQLPWTHPATAFPVVMPAHVRPSVEPPTAAMHLHRDPHILPSPNPTATSSLWLFPFTASYAELEVVVLPLREYGDSTTRLLMPPGHEIDTTTYDALLRRMSVQLQIAGSLAVSGMELHERLHERFPKVMEGADFLPLYGLLQEANTHDSTTERLLRTVHISKDVPTGVALFGYMFTIQASYLVIQEMLLNVLHRHIRRAHNFPAQVSARVAFVSAPLVPALPSAAAMPLPRPPTSLMIAAEVATVINPLLAYSASISSPPVPMGHGTDTTSLISLTRQMFLRLQIAASLQVSRKEVYSRLNAQLPSSMDPAMFHNHYGLLLQASKSPTVAERVSRAGDICPDLHTVVALLGRFHTSQATSMRIHEMLLHALRINIIRANLVGPPAFEQLPVGHA